MNNMFRLTFANNSIICNLPPPLLKLKLGDWLEQIEETFGF